MTKRYISPQSGPVGIKTDKDSHTPRTGHTKPAGRQNEAHTPTTEEVETCWESKGDIGNPYETEADWLKSRRLKKLAFKKWLSKVKAKAWEEGSDAGYAFAIRHPDQIPVNPYESEKTDES
jgi:hypothetical protein